jgi:hypothetical protein
VIIKASLDTDPLIFGTKEVTVIPGALDHYAIIPASTSVVTGSQQTATITAQDANNNAIASIPSATLTMTIISSATPEVSFYVDGDYDTTTTTYSYSGGTITIYYTAAYETAANEQFTIHTTDGTIIGDSAAITITD